MRTIISAAAFVLLSVSAHATNTPPKDPVANAHSDASASGVGLGIGVGVAEGGDAVAVAQGGKGGSADARSASGAVAGAQSGDSVSSATSGDSAATATSGDSSATQSQEAYSEGSNASSDNSVNITSTYRGVRNAPSVALGSIFPTASCQAGVGIGGSGVNGSGLFNFSFTKKECEAFLLAQHFVSIGMPDISCEILKTTKAFQRAVKIYPQLDMLTDCSPLPTPKSSKIETAPAPPVDLSGYATKEELDRAFKKAQQK